MGLYTPRQSLRAGARVPHAVPAAPACPSYLAASRQPHAPARRYLSAATPHTHHNYRNQSHVLASRPHSIDFRRHTRRGSLSVQEKSHVVKQRLRTGDAECTPSLPSRTTAGGGGSRSVALVQAWSMRSPISGTASWMPASRTSWVPASAPAEE